VSYCNAPDCMNVAPPGSDLCGGHRKRLQRGQPVATPLRQARSPWSILTDAAIRYADVDDERAYGRASDNLRRAAESYVKRKGK
jgi:hypothetical protein